MMRLHCISNRRSKQAGFTLIEVLIASAITIASMGLLMQLFSSGLDRMNRVSLNANLIIAEKELINRLQMINPALISEGAGTVEGLEFSWEAKVVKPFAKMSENIGDDNFPKYVALYEIDIDLTRSNGNVSELNITRIGWKDSP
jgi:prepilin-type N-terminal cleavage/methylation domain-containing protein